MKKAMVALFGAIALASTAHAAGVNKIVRGTIDETKLAGYSATSPFGWQQFIQYAVMTSAKDPVQKVAALVGSWPSALTKNLPNPFAITTISLETGAVLTKDTLPGLAQIPRSTCSGFSCPTVVVASVRPDRALPSRLIVTISWMTFGNWKFTTVSYAFDPDGVPGSGTRWTLLENVTGLDGYATQLGSGGRLHTNFYAFKRTSPTTVQIVQIVNR